MPTDTGHIGYIDMGVSERPGQESVGAVVFEASGLLAGRDEASAGNLFARERREIDAIVGVSVGTGGAFNGLRGFDDRRTAGAERGADVVPVGGYGNAGGGDLCELH